jgi:PIN domain nuclease of toxin-antitoxin system
MPQRTADLIETLDDDVFVSVASLWEMAIKVGKGSWVEAAWLVDHFESEVVASDCLLLQITPSHAREAGLMPGAHRDPFDRLLAAQARLDGLTVVTVDPGIASLGVPTLW